MAYEAEEVLSSQEIFYYLLEHHELREEDEPLYIRPIRKRKQSGIW